jgi:hypothetical protein
MAFSAQSLGAETHYRASAPSARERVRWLAVFNTGNHTLDNRFLLGCVAPVLWRCMSLQVALLVVPLRTLTAGNDARAHGARAKAGTQYFFLFFQILCFIPTVGRKVTAWKA